LWLTPMIGLLGLRLCIGWKRPFTYTNSTSTPNTPARAWAGG
jgi:hypothetical protein